MGFAALTLFVALIATSAERPVGELLAAGAVAAAFVFSGAAYLLVARGKPAGIGRFLVSKPHFVKAVSHAAGARGRRGRGSSGSARALFRAVFAAERTALATAALASLLAASQGRTAIPANEA